MLLLLTNLLYFTKKRENNTLLLLTKLLYIKTEVTIHVIFLKIDLMDIFLESHVTFNL